MTSVWALAALWLGLALVASLLSIWLRTRFAFAVDLARQNKAELHMVSVEEIPYMPDSIEEVREEKGTAARRFHTVVQRATAMAQGQHVKLRTHLIAGHPVRDIITLAGEIRADLLVTLPAIPPFTNA